MNILLMLSCQDLYSYDEKNITVSCREITKLGEAESYKKNRLKYLGIQTSWEQGLLLTVTSGKPVETQVVWDQKVPLKVKIVLNEKALELKKEGAKKTSKGLVGWHDDFLLAQAALNGLQQAQVQAQVPQPDGPVNPVPNAPIQFHF